MRTRAELKGFNETFEDYHDLLRSEIAKDIELDTKIHKIESLIYLLDSIVGGRFSKGYIEQADEFRRQLEDNRNTKIGFNNDNTRRNRLKLLIDWLSILLREHEPFKLYRNYKRVQMNAGD